MSGESRVLVVGGGVIGVCCAYYLSRRGVPVTVLDRDEVCSRGGSTYANAGLVVPSDVYPLATPGALGRGLRWLTDSSSPFYIAPRPSPSLLRWLALFNAAAREEPMMRAIPVVRALQRASSDLFDELAGTIDGLGYRQNGWVWVFETAEGLKSEIGEMERVEPFGVRLRELTVDELAELAPGLNRSTIVGAMMHEEDGHVAPDSFVLQLAAAAEAAGTEFLTAAEVFDVETAGRRVTALVTTRGRVPADTVVLAAGSWTPGLGRRLGLRLPVEPAKGYSVTVAQPQPPLELPLYSYESAVAITPFGDRLRFAGTLELSGFDMRIRLRRVEGIRRGAGKVLAGAAQMDPLEIWRGPRPCTPDGLPIIGRSPRHDNVIVATGHCMQGLSLGPVTGKLVSELVEGERPEIDLGPLAPDRFRF